MSTLPAIPPEPPRLIIGRELNRQTHRWQDIWATFAIEAQTPGGWFPAAHAATLAIAAGMVVKRDGLSTAVPSYRVTRAGEVLFGPA